MNLYERCQELALRRNDLFQRADGVTILVTHPCMWSSYFEAIVDGDEVNIVPLEKSDTDLAEFDFICCIDEDEREAPASDRHFEFERDSSGSEALVGKSRTINLDSRHR